jgi:transcriptional regulator with XRE-family HTH domain
LDALAPKFEIAAGLLRARLRAGLSQAELATRMGTSQTTIARLESGQTLLSTKTLLRYAEATGSKFTCGCRRLDTAFSRENTKSKFNARTAGGAQTTDRPKATGLRRGDAVRLGRPHVRDGIGTIKTEKSGYTVEVTLPILPVLAQTLDVARAAT